MMRSVMAAIRAALGAMAARAGAMAAAFLVYLALIGAVYVFITTREATIPDLILTFALPLLVLVLFFFIQAVGVRYTGASESTQTILRSALSDTGKLLVVSLPVALLAILVVLGLELIGYWWRGDNQFDESGFVLTYLLPGVRAVILYLAVPLIAARLWIAAVRDGVGGAYRAFGRHFVGAFALKSLLIYVLAVGVFGALAWGLIGMRTPYGGAWAEIGLLVTRLGAAGLVIFIGWLLALGALARAGDEG